MALIAIAVWLVPAAIAVLYLVSRYRKANCFIVNKATSLSGVMIIR